MNKLITLLVCVTVTAFTGVLNAQDTKVLKGRVISEGFELLPGIKIYDLDTVFLGLTDIDGYFELEAPTKTKELLLGFVAMEWTNIKIEECQNLEIIMMVDVIYDFISAESEQRKRQKRFKQLPKKHKEAYEQGIFKSSEPCVCYVYKEY